MRAHSLDVPKRTRQRRSIVSEPLKTLVEFGHELQDGMHSLPAHTVQDLRGNAISVTAVGHIHHPCNLVTGSPEQSEDGSGHGKVAEKKTPAGGQGEEKHNDGNGHGQEAENIGSHGNSSRKQPQQSNAAATAATATGPRAAVAALNHGSCNGVMDTVNNGAYLSRGPCGCQMHVHRGAGPTLTVGRSCSD